MTLLFHYTIKNSFNRKVTSFLTIAGVALVVFVFCATLMLSYGLEKSLVESGNDKNVVVMRASSSTEIISVMWRSMGDAVKSDPAVMADKIAGEIVVLINQPKRITLEPSNVPVRGVDDGSFAIRPQIKIVEGRKYNAGTNEIIAGAKVTKTFNGCGVGETLRFAGQDWTVVGIFEAAGGSFESELWGDYNQMAQAFQRPIYSSLTFQLDNPAQFDEVKKRLESDRRLTVDVMTEKEYYYKQSKSFSGFITILGTTISIIFGAGAIFGAMITMYASVSNRTREIGTLRALGFPRRAILFAFLTESLIISITGGLLGVALANILNFSEFSTTNFDTFSEVAFPFRMSLGIAIDAVIFSIVMGLIGGFLPAVRAARFKIIDALRSA